MKSINLRPKAALDLAQKDITAHLIKGYLKKNETVKITVMFRGREIFHPELGFELITFLKDAIDDEGFLLEEPKFNGRNLIATFIPAGGTALQPAYIGA